MDTSKEYIKMCEKTPKELWDQIKDRNGTYFAWRGVYGILKPSPDRGPMSDLASIVPETLVIRTWLNEKEDIMVLGSCDYGTDRGTPLYRQDQLQEIAKSLINGSGTKTIALLQAMWRFHKKVTWEVQFSMEQLWLAFVMSERFNKHWSGNEWEVINHG